MIVIARYFLRFPQCSNVCSMLSLAEPHGAARAQAAATVPRFSWQIPVLASPGLSCSDSVPAVVVVREGGRREAGRGGEGEEGGETRHGAVSWNRLVQATLLGEYQTLRLRKLWTSQITELQSKKKTLSLSVK